MIAQTSVERAYLRALHQNQALRGVGQNPTQGGSCVKGGRHGVDIAARVRQGGILVDMAQEEFGTWVGDGSSRANAPIKEVLFFDKISRGISFTERLIDKATARVAFL